MADADAAPSGAASLFSTAAIENERTKIIRLAALLPLDAVVRAFQRRDVSTSFSRKVHRGHSKQEVTSSLPPGSIAALRKRALARCETNDGR